MRTLGAMKQTPLLEFESSAFAVIPGEDRETNPGIYGKALAQWLAERLRAAGFAPGPVIAEDFGWCVPVQSKPHSLYVACASRGEKSGQWRVFGFAEGGLMTPPTQSQTLPGTGSCPIRDSCIKNIEADDIGNSTLTTHERSAARAICPVRRARESSARPARAVPPGGDSAHTGSAGFPISSPGPAVCGSGAAASRGITRAGGDGGVHREASGQSGAAAPR